MKQIKYLDHGFVVLRNLAGPTRRADQEFDADDTDPANTARMSFDQMDSDRTRAQEIKLCDYLMRNWHTSPFEMIECWIEMKLPIFIARQIIRHRTSSVNEVSARYVQLPAEWHIPELEDVVLQSVDKKQGGTLVDLGNPEQVKVATRYVERLDADCKTSYEFYQHAIADGIAMELARLHLHVNHYTHWIWKQDLHNIFHLLSLRDHSHAQRPAQYLAQAIDGAIRAQLPELMRLYDEYRKRK